MSYERLLLILSVLPVLLIGLFIYKKDKEKEPTALLTKLFFGGIGACFLTLLITFILKMIFPFLKVETSELNLIQLLLYAFLVVALVEEFSKWFFVYIISYNNKEFDELYDMILYSTFVALGFACFENILYVFQGGVITGIVRALLAVPSHACDGVIMGYYLGLSKNDVLNNNGNKHIKYLVLSIIVPTILHGTYDYLLFTGRIIFLIIFFAYVIIVYIFIFKKIKKITLINKKIKYKDNYCPICGHIVESNFCPGCGRKNN